MSDAARPAPQPPAVGRKRCETHMRSAGQRSSRLRCSIRSADKPADSTKILLFINVSACNGVLVFSVLHRADFASGRIESHHRGRRNRASPIGVKAAAKQLRTCVLFVLVVGNRTPDLGRHVRFRRCSADLFDQQSAGRECLIAKRESRQPHPRAACQPAILRDRSPTVRA